MKWSECIWINTVNNLKQLFFGIHFISIFQNLDNLNLIPFLNFSPNIHFTLPYLHFPLLLLITFPRLPTQLTSLNVCCLISFHLLLSQSLFIFLFLKLLRLRIIAKFISLIVIVIIPYIIVILGVMHGWPIRTLLFSFVFCFETLAWFCSIWRFTYCPNLRNRVNVRCLSCILRAICLFLWTQLIFLNA